VLPPRLLHLLVLSALAALLWGCGGSDASAPPTTTAAQPPPRAGTPVAAGGTLVASRCAEPGVDGCLRLRLRVPAGYSGHELELGNRGSWASFQRTDPASGCAFDFTVTAAKPGAAPQPPAGRGVRSGSLTLSGGEHVSYYAAESLPLQIPATITSAGKRYALTLTGSSPVRESDDGLPEPCEEGQMTRAPLQAAMLQALKSVSVLGG
jgi:hypothetical protein